MVGHSSVRRSGSTDHKVGWPSDNKVQRGLKGTPHSDSCLFTKGILENIAVPDRWAVIVWSTFFGNVGLTQFRMVCKLVVDGVRSLPTVVGNQKQRVQQVSYGVLEFFVFGKSWSSSFESEKSEIVSLDSSKPSISSETL